MKSVAFVLLTTAAALGADTGPAKKAPAPPESVTLRVTGLFDPSRVDDFRELVGKVDGLTLVELDYERAEATFTYDRKALGVGKPEQVQPRIDSVIHQACRGVFGVRPRSTFPREKLKRLEIGIIGMDCKGCCLGAYEIVAKLEGVEQATVSFREGRLVAWIDPAKTNRAALEAALRKRQVKLADAAPKP
jgi:copper chaperone CopZ